MSVIALDGPAGSGKSTIAGMHPAAILTVVSLLVTLRPHNTHLSWCCHETIKRGRDGKMGTVTAFVLPTVKILITNNV